MARAAQAKALAAVATLAAAFPGVASAHARFVSSDPANGAVLAKGPQDVRVVFDDTVLVSGGNAAIRNGGGSVLGGRPRVVGGRTLVLPLRARLADGDYSVRWSILSDDGHREQGVLAFAVGIGRAPPTPALTASGAVSVSGAISRTLWLLGVMLAGGAAIFALVTRTPPDWRVLFAGFLLTFLGASSLEHDVSGTRFGLVTEIGATIALVGGALAALTSVERRLRWPALLAGLALLPLPTLGGHALDPGHSRVLAALLDFSHLTAAAAWFGGLAVLATASRMAPANVRRFSQLALVSVVVIGLAGLGNAIVELARPGQLGSTGYGQAILVKTGLFAVALLLGWTNRTQLLDRFSELRRSVAFELVLLLGVVTAAGVLTELKPGRVEARAAAAPIAKAVPARLPPPGRLTLAQRDGSVAVALTIGPRATVTLIGPDGNAYETSGVTIGGTAATSCGAGCWLGGPVGAGIVPVRVDKLPAVRFDVPADPAPAGAVARRARAAFRAAPSVSIAERLASGPEPPQLSQQRAESPNRFRYRIASGPQGIVIGNRRWDRPRAGTPWVAGVQQPALSMPAPLWGPRSRNAYVITQTPATRTVALLDPSLPAWFELRLDRRTNLPLDIRMTAAAHFMTERYTDYGTPREIRPPTPAR